MARTTRKTIRWTATGDVWWEDDREGTPRAHRGTTRCGCQAPRDKWHRKRERRLAQAGATPREVRRKVGW